MSVAVNRVVVIGAGHAGVEIAASLRQHGFSGKIDLVSDDENVPYHRPPLSKDYLKRPGVPLQLKPRQFFSDKDISLHLGLAAEMIDRKNQVVQLSDGQRLTYDHLVLALGARSRKSPIPGLDDTQVLELRTLHDADRIVTLLDRWRSVAIVGGGFVGLEFAGFLALKGIRSSIVEMSPRLMQRSVSPALSWWFLDHHRAAGTAVYLNDHVVEAQGTGDRFLLTLASGTRLDVDAVLVATGIVPNSELAQAAGLNVGNGIVVNDMLLTDDPRISAVGDCAFYPSQHFQGSVRLESVQNAVDHAKTVAARLSGTAKPYESLPWFWSVQGDNARLQIAGLGHGCCEDVVRGDPHSGRFSVFRFDGIRLACVESVNSPADHMVGRKLIAAAVSPSPESVVDTARPLPSLLADVQVASG